MAKDNDKMPERWERAIVLLLLNPDKRTPYSLREIRKVCAVGGDFMRALSGLDMIRFIGEGRHRFPCLIGEPTAEEIRAQIAKDRKAQDERRDAALIEEMNRTENVCHTIGSTAENWKNYLKESGRWVDTTLAEAVEIITAAGGTVVFGDTIAKEHINKAHVAKNMEAMARKK